MEPDGIVLRVTEELEAQLTKTTEYEGTHYYAHNNGEHRIIWIFTEPVEELIGENIEIRLVPNQYGSKKLALEQYAGRPHLEIRMRGIADPAYDPRDLSTILAVAPRNDGVGRKPIVQNGIFVRAKVSPEIAEVFRDLGQGNVSEGMRIAGAILAERTKKKSP